MTLAGWLAEQSGMTIADFARRLSKRLARPVHYQNVWRWTRDPAHPDYSVPEPDTVVAIYFETGKQVPVESWYAHMLNKPAAKKRRRAA